MTCLARKENGVRSEKDMIEKVITVHDTLSGETIEMGIEEDEFYLIASENTLPVLAENGTVGRLADVLVEAIESICRRWSHAAGVSSDEVKTKLYLRMLAMSEDVIRRYEEYDDDPSWYGARGDELLD